MEARNRLTSDDVICERTAAIEVTKHLICMMSLDPRAHEQTQALIMLLGELTTIGCLDYETSRVCRLYALARHGATLDTLSRYVMKA